MKNIATTFALVFTTSFLAHAQVATFTNITEASVGLQVGKTTKITSFNSGELKESKNGYKFPAPRIATSFGATLADILYIGPGVAYTFQPRDADNGYAHQVSAFGQARLSLGQASIRPFLDFKGGYHFASWEETSLLFDKNWYKWDGFFSRAGIGAIVFY